ncbi:MAG: LicD family protein [Clostridia bacterium]|nr:LicD family protein [Clostridia bacterium]
MINGYGNFELHKSFLEAMVDYDAVCRKYDLKYCIHGGTALGAIRHKGFIPWDDDVDIVMLRKDYDKFIKIAPKEFGNKYTVQTYKTEKKMLTNVMKIRINNCKFLNDDGTDNNKAFLDIFPMSDVPNSKVGQSIQNKLVIFLNNVVYAKIGYIELQSIASKVVFGTLSKLPRRFLGDIIECVIKYFPHFRSKYVDIVATANYLECTGYAMDLWPKSFFEETELTEFCGKKFRITKHWNEYLTQMYGDYMTPPEESKRQNKHGMKAEEH